MLIFDFHQIGSNLLNVRKKMGKTQSEVAELAGLSDRTYADIERGNVNMRIETIMKICNALNITPDTILTAEYPSLSKKQEDLLKDLDTCSVKEKETALNILAAYLQSIKI